MSNPLLTSRRRRTPREHARPATADGPLCNPWNRTAALRSRRPRHARGVGKGRAALGRREGTSEGTRVARMPRWAALARGRRTATGAGAVGACGSELLAVIYSECPCLTAIFFRNLNRSAQCDQQESCRSHYPLQLSQKPYSVFLNGFCRNVV
jgi:hypothetical protein